MGEKVLYARQAGITALRAPDGTFLPAVPLYALTTDIEEMYEKTGRNIEDELMDFSVVTKHLAFKFAEYVEADKAAKAERKAGRKKK